MSRLFRRGEASFASWASLALFALAYLSALGLILAPGLAVALFPGAP